MPPLPPTHTSFSLNVEHVAGVRTPMATRPNVKADKAIIGSVITYEEYRLPIEDFKPKLIIDCGGNIGCSAVYFANKYPGAQIYSIEPEKNHFQLLKFNTCLYENIHAINSGLWDKDTFIRVENRGYGYLGWMTFETTEDDPNAFRTVTVSKILKNSGFDTIDFLKVDIEGAEKEVFGAPDVHDWLSKVNVIAIELHDRMKTGCGDAFFKAISKYNWYFTFRGENLMFIREDRIAEKVIHALRW